MTHPLPGAFDTPRLHLRPLVDDDAALYVGLYTNPAVMRHIGVPLSRAAAEHAFTTVGRQLRRQPPAAAYWVLVPRMTGVPAGLVVLVFEASGRCAELGLLFAGEIHRQGFAGEAVAALLDRVFALSALDRVRTRSSAANAAVDRLMRRLGFRRDGMSADVQHWSMTRDAWLKENRDRATFAMSALPG